MIKEIFHTSESAHLRQHYLQEALSLASGTGFLTVEQRILINQERGALLAFARKMDGTATSTKFTKSISAPLEERVKRIYKTFK